MKTIRIILLILILIGIALLVTQKIWVPKVVDKILLSEGAPTVIPPATTSQTDMVLADGRQCYVYEREASADAPYAVHEFIDMNISGSVVTGTKTGTQAGLDMTNGYEGTLTGTLEKNSITAVFSYEIEGSKNKEKEIYRAGAAGIEKLRYPLVEEKGILVPDTAKEFSILRYARVGCEASN